MFQLLDFLLTLEGADHIWEFGYSEQNVEKVLLEEGVDIVGTFGTT